MWSFLILNVVVNLTSVIEVLHAELNCVHLRRVRFGAFRETTPGLSPINSCIPRVLDFCDIAKSLEYL